MGIAAPGESVPAAYKVFGLGGGEELDFSFLDGESRELSPTHPRPLVLKMAYVSYVYI